MYVEYWKKSNVYVVKKLPLRLEWNASNCKENMADLLALTCKLRIYLQYSEAQINLLLSCCRWL